MRSFQLDIDRLQCIRDDRELFSGLSFSLQHGEVLQIEGPNGCGKTSLLRIVCGLRTPDDGVVNWCGQDIRGHREDYYGRMVYLGHLPCIKGDLDVMENITALLDTRSMSLGENTVVDALSRVGLAGFEDVPGKALSSGQRRRVLLAFLDLAGADLWILDEPLTALDVQGVELVERMILQHREDGGSVIFTTHHGMQLDCDMRSVALGKQREARVK